MVVALFLAAGSALLGGALALLARQRRSLLERTRTFAFAAATGVVVFHLLPEVLPALGLRALVFMAAGFALPWLLEAGTHALAPRAGQGRPSHLVAAEVGFLALAFHSLIEGLTLWAALEAPGSHFDLEVAIVAHHAPLTAAVALPFLELRGPRKTAVRIGGIALCGALGVLLGQLLPSLASLPLEKLLLPAMAATAGALLHVAFDEISEQRFASSWERAADLFACAAGFGVAAGSALWKAPDPAQVAGLEGFAAALESLASRAGPALLIGAAAALWRHRARASSRWPARAAQALAPDALLLTLTFFGPLALLLRALGSLALALGLCEPAAPRPAGLGERAPWVLLALLLAATLVLLGAPEGLAGPAEAALSALATLALAFANPAAATLLAAALAAKGAPLPALLAALAVGSAFSAALRTDARAALAAALTCAAIAGAASLLGKARLQALSLGGLSSPAVGRAALALWLLLVLVQVWRRGARGFFAPLRAGSRAAIAADRSPP